METKKAYNELAPDVKIRALRHLASRMCDMCRDNIPLEFDEDGCLVHVALSEPTREELEDDDYEPVFEILKCRVNPLVWKKMNEAVDERGY